jgi:hypothetical protein
MMTDMRRLRGTHSRPSLLGASADRLPKLPCRILRSNDMLNILAFLTRREDIETRAFIEYYENHHVPLICSMAPTPIVYKRNHLMRGDELNTQEDDTPTLTL